MNDIGSLYIVAAPSGTGKTSLVKALTDSLPQITVSISHTTRPKRPNEVDGVHYYFTHETNFKKMIAENDFLEYAAIFGHYYGTSKRWVESTLAKGIDVILEIDWQGHQQIKRLFKNAIGIFILPPSLQSLKLRLHHRQQDSEAVINERLQDVYEAVSHIDEFDYVVVNDVFSQTLEELQAIVKAGHFLKNRQLQKLSPLIAEFKSIK